MCGDRLIHSHGVIASVQRGEYPSRSENAVYILTLFHLHMPSDP